MTRSRMALLCALAILLLPLSALARDIAPIVDVDWLEKNLSSPKVKIVDIRKLEVYKEGHVPNAINVFYGSWAISRKGLQNELPEDDDLMDVIGAAGITPDLQVVVVGKTDAVPDRVNLTRVAWTLKYAGVENVAILDGGYNKWTAAKKPPSKDMVKPAAVQYKGTINKGIFAGKDYVMGQIGKAAIIDTRAPEFFFGVAKLDFVAKAGHIKSAVSLPSPWIFTADGSFRDKADLEAMAANVVGKDLGKEMITYCDTGRLCSGWWFILSEVLGYKNVKAYDGSMEEWAKDANAPVVKFSWN